MNQSLAAVTLNCTRVSFLKALVLAGLRNPILSTGPGNAHQTDTAFAFHLHIYTHTHTGS